MVSFEHWDCIFSFQIHVVHYNTKYDSFTEAMVHPDGLAVLGAFLEVSFMEQQLEDETGLGRVGHSFGDQQRCKCTLEEGERKGRSALIRMKGSPGIRCLSQGAVPPCCHHHLASWPCCYLGVSVLQVGHGENQYYHEILKHLNEIQEVGKALSHLVLCVRGCSPAEKPAAQQSCSTCSATLPTIFMLLPSKRFVPVLLPLCFLSQDKKPWCLDSTLQVCCLPT